MYRLIRVLFCIFSFLFVCPETLAYTQPDTINYNETLETFNNPERGFYEPLGLNLKPENNNSLHYSSNLVHLRVNIGAFSGKKNGTQDLELTENALKALNDTLKYIKDHGGSVIIRFAYDFDGKANLEPEFSMILRHIEQLKDTFYENRDVITYVELGFFGPWGEMHTSKVSTTANVSIAIDKMLEVLPEEIKLGVRTPNYFATWAGIQRNQIDMFKAEKDSKYYRVGLFNDGYLGSESDLGTFANREKEITWLNNQAKYTLYGGEVVANYASGEALNTIRYMAKEAFITHTTYLNLRWNYDVIDAWKKEIYNGEDSLYQGQSGFKYIDNHLGYRFVLKNSSINNEKGYLNLNLAIENVGFANLINKKKVTIVLEGVEHLYELPTDIDPTSWDSRSLTNIQKSLKIPSEVAPGTYRVYLRISYYGNLTTDNNYKAIRLANADIYNNELGANYLGKVEISKYTEPKDAIITFIRKTNEIVICTPEYTINKEKQTSNVSSHQTNKEIKKENPSSVINNQLAKPEEKPSTSVNNNSNNKTDNSRKDYKKGDAKTPNNDNSFVLVIFFILGLILAFLIIKEVRRKSS